jgi:hypothetical protein
MALSWSTARPLLRRRRLLAHFAIPEEIPLEVAAPAPGPGALGLTAGVEGLPLEERLQLVMGAWQSGLPRFLVFDNCEW